MQGLFEVGPQLTGGRLITPTSSSFPAALKAERSGDRVQW